MTRQREKRNINTEEHSNVSMCCCMPCIGAFVIGENICKGIFLGILWILSCPCVKIKCINPCRVTPNNDLHIEVIDTNCTTNTEYDNEDMMEIVPFSEETKENNNQSNN